MTITAPPIARHYVKDWLQAAGEIGLADGAHGSRIASPEDQAQIEMDLHRCGREELGVSDEDAASHRAGLRRVLLSFCADRPYCQALSHVAAALLVLTSGDEADALKLLALLATTLAPDFYGAPDLVGARAEIGALVILAEGKCAVAGRSAVQEALSIAATEWLLSLWVGTLPLEQLVVVWDAMIAEATEPRPASASLRLGLAVVCSAAEEVAQVLRECAAVGNEGDEVYQAYAVLKEAAVSGGAEEATHDMARQLQLPSELLSSARAQARERLAEEARRKLEMKRRRAEAREAAERTPAPGRLLCPLSSLFCCWPCVPCLPDAKSKPLLKDTPTDILGTGSCGDSALGTTAPASPLRSRATDRDSLSPAPPQAEP